MKSGRMAVFAALLVLAVCFQARGEVSAKLDESCTYVGMIIKYSGSSPPRIWSAPAPTASRRPLNPTGDILGDLAPVVAENPANSNLPWVVWPHPNGGDLDLVFSRWTGTGWTPAQFVQLDNFTNEYDPRLVFNSSGRPYMVWWSSDGQTGTVYFSMFLETRWMTPVTVSLAGSDGRRPSLKILDDQHVLVVYDGVFGREERELSLPYCDSITDDIDPKLRSMIIIE